MEDQRIGSKCATLAKKAGLTLKYCDALYNNGNLVEMSCNSSFVEEHDVWSLAPTQSLLQKRLRSKNVVVLVEHGRLSNNSFGYFSRVYPNIKNGGSGQFKVFEYRKKYEDALEQGLIGGLFSLINKKKELELQEKF